MNGQRKPTVAERFASGQLNEVEAVELAREAALSSLDRAMQSRQTLQTKLLQRGYPAGVINQVLDRLEAVGVLDDAVYAQAVVRARLERGLAPRAIKVELARKGVSAEHSQSALAQIDVAQQADAARRVAAKALRTCHQLPSELRARRVYVALSRRGYSSEVALAALNEFDLEAVGAD